MKDFDRWFSAGLEDRCLDDRSLPEGITEIDGVFYAECVVCEKTCTLDFDLDEIPRAGYAHHCNGSPWCVP